MSKLRAQPPIRFVLALLAVGLSACAVILPHGPTAPEPPMIDPHSCSRPATARVTHVSLDLVADFAAHVLRGTATLVAEIADGATELALDTDGLAVESVTDGNGRPLRFRLDARDEVLGSALRIDPRLDGGVGAASTFVIRYRTSPDAAALQWLEPRQTSGPHPFLFTQGQAILTRTWIPCQDTPSVRQTWDATITVTNGLVAVMSALGNSTTGEKTDAGTRFRFHMPHPVPSYLIALAIGDLEFRAISERCGVWAEPAVVESARFEFADTERMVLAAESLWGPYRWGRYDVLVLPPSFPFGGMENPCLTFATPTVIAGDRSLVALIAHELAHSWSGNLVTNAEWADLWLNEGFTVFAERRIVESLYGVEQRTMQAVLGFQDLEDDLRTLGPDSPDTRLHQNLAGRNPDDAFSNVPYEKGALFLESLERAVGRDRFDRFLHEYFERHAFGTMTTDRFLALVRSDLFAGDPGAFERLHCREWVENPGLLDGVGPPHSAAFDRVNAARNAFVSSGDAAALPADRWTTQEWLHFLRGLPRDLASERVAAIDRAFHLSDRKNSEVLFEWLRIAIRRDYQPAMPALEGFLTRQGRRKFLKPLYSDLCETSAGLARAEAIYAKARPGYHAVSARTIDDLLAKARAKQAR